MTSPSHSQFTPEVLSIGTVAVFGSLQQLQEFAPTREYVRGELPIGIFAGVYLLARSLISNTVERKHVRVSSEGMKFNIGSIERDVFYEVEYEGKQYALRVTEDGFLENYEVESS